MDPAILITVVAAIFSCIFSAINAALRVFSRVRLTELLEASGQQARAERFFERVPKLQLMAGTLRTLANFAVLLAMLYWIESLFDSRYRIIAYLIAFGLAMTIVSIFGVAIPNSWARYHPERLLAWSRRPLEAMLVVFMPVANFLSLFDPLVRRITGVTIHTPQEAVTDEVMSVVEEHATTAGALVDQTQKQMLQAVFDLPTTTVGEVMTPRTEIQGIELSASQEEIKAAVLSEGHSRIPVYEGNLDHILGILYVKDLIHTVTEHQPIDLRKVLREPMMVPESKPVRELLTEFKSRKMHLAVVIDEYGGTAGLVTIEDIIEEIVGEIQDEYEKITEKPMLRRVDERTSEVDARMRVVELNQALQLTLPEDAEYDTVGGYVIATLGRIPSTGESVEHNGCRLTVIEAQRTKVTRVRVERQAAAQASVT